MVSSPSEASSSDQPASPNPLAPSAPVSIVPGLWRRMACWLYEGMLLFAVVFVAGWLFSTLTQMRNGVDSSRHPMLQGFLFLVLGVYFTWFWSRGQTLAMKTWGIRVVDRAGRPVSQPRALLRYLLSWLWFLPALVSAWALGLHGGGAIIGSLMAGMAAYLLIARLHPQRQFLHDTIAGSRVITQLPQRS